MQDEFTGRRGILEGQGLDFGLELTLFTDDLLLLGVPEITIKNSSQALICQGPDAIVLRVTTTLVRAVIPLLTGLKNGFWFANFDGTILSEFTPWLLDAKRTDVSLISMRLPRSAIGRSDFPFYEIQEGASIILRATPEIMPFPILNLFAKAELLDLFGNIPRFDCCFDADCNLKFRNTSFFCNSQRLCTRR